MRFFLLAFLMPLISFAGSGEPVFPAPGSYSFQKNFEVLQKRRYEIIYSFTDEGMARMHELENQGYACNGSTRDTFLCTAFESVNGDYPGLAERLEKILDGATATFGEIRGPAELLRKSSSGTEWTMPQSVDFRGHHYDSFRFILAKESQRITLGEPAEHAFVVDDSGKIGYSMTVPVTESRTVYRRYLGLADFVK